MHLLTLLTDFGLQDVYVGVMKGVIAQIAPTVQVIDLTHEIPPQNLLAARFHLLNAYPFFPEGTVHVAVVDPGVGSQRRAIALQLADGFLVGPDNGIWSGILAERAALTAVELTQPQFWRNAAPSHTFHGRDIFAAVGAYLAIGTPIEAIGTVIDAGTLSQLNLPKLTQVNNRITGAIQHIDRFGNLISTIPGYLITSQHWTVNLNGCTLPGKCSYSDSAIGQGVALIGSHGYVEVAINRGNAQSQFQLQWGDDITVEFI
jgi:hypothetical protein